MSTLTSPGIPVRIPGHFIEPGAMKIFITLFSLLLATHIFCTASASSVDQEIGRVAGEVAQLKLGFDNYFIGHKLTSTQKATAQRNAIEKSLQGTYKFKDGEIFVVAAQEDDTVLGVYKQYPEVAMDELKKIVGSLMFEYGEPTATAHDKMIYWTYNENGKIDQDTFEFEKDSGGSEPIGTIKFSSSERIGSEQKEQAQPISAYLMITSDPLSKLFLALSKQ